jgi:DNA invertase Pin-like site-specific DNA recombinase
MVGPLPAGRKWTISEEKQLRDLLASGVKATEIARQLKWSAGAVYARINKLKNAPRRRSVASRFLSTLWRRCSQLLVARG